MVEREGVRVWGVAMGAMEKGQEGGGNNSSMPRPPSVDDLFAPMCRLDVQSLGAGLSSSVSAAEGVGWSEASFGVTRNLVSRIVEKAPTTSSTSGEQPVCTFRERLCLSSWFALVGKVGEFRIWHTIRFVLSVFFGNSVTRCIRQSMLKPIP